MKKRGATKQASKGSESRSPSLMDNVENMLKVLETKGTSSEDLNSTLQSLQQLYREISIKNKVDSKREELIQHEITELQRKNVEAVDATKKLQQEYQATESKVIKLENLSRTLSGRVKSIESKASEDVKAEKDDRLRLSYEFSAKIKDISSKLDDLSKRREAIITENARLKDVLRECFDQFDNDPDLQVTAEAEDGSGDPFDIRDGDDYVDSDKELEPEQRQEKKERITMEREEDNLRLKSLREQEEFLKLQSAKFMSVFDSFQQRLTESNHLFKIKQGRVEEIAKDIKNIEKQNNDMTARIAECTVSSRNLSGTIEKLREEKEKYSKLIDKQKSLIEKFQGDVVELESAR